MSYARPNIDQLDPYVPGEQPAQKDVVKLNTNENPYPPTAQVIDAIAKVTGDQLRRYPSPDASAFLQVAASVHGLDPQQIIATNGGDELLRLAITVFCEPAAGDSKSTSGGGGGIGIASPGYSLYPVLAGIHNTPVTSVPLADDWSIPSDFAGQMLSAGVKLVMIVNPHAPTGRLESVDRLTAIAGELKGKAVLLIDEAYVDFADHDALKLLDPAGGLDNVMLLRTLSKGYSLAGLRFGYGLAHPALITAMNKARDSYNTNVLAQQAAIAALSSRDQAKLNCQLVCEQREAVTNKLCDLGWQIPKSQSNFILAAPAGSPDARTIFNSLKRQGIFVRYFDQERLDDKLRITIGTPQQNDELLAALGEICQ